MPELITIDRFEIRNSNIVLPSTVLMMNDASEGMTTINHIWIDNCLVTGINDTKYVTKQFGFIHAINKGSNVWNDVSVTNSTFYEFYISPGVFGVLTADVPVSANAKVSISNCTFYNYCTTDFEQAADTGLTLIDLGMSDSSFFRNAKDGDFTIINTGSTVYTQEYGDPRWITVSEY